MPLGLRQDARVLQMPEAHVVRGNREPGAIGLRDALRDFLPHFGEILGAGENALARAVAIRHAHRGGRVRREHHHAARAIAGGGHRIPLGFLVADRGEQAPVHLVLRWQPLRTTPCTGAAARERDPGSCRDSRNSKRRASPEVRLASRSKSPDFSMNLKNRLTSLQQIAGVAAHQPIASAASAAARSRRRTSGYRCRAKEYSRASTSAYSRLARAHIFQRVGRARALWPATRCLARQCA